MEQSANKSTTATHIVNAHCPPDKVSAARESDGSNNQTDACTHERTGARRSRETPEDLL